MTNITFSFFFVMTKVRRICFIITLSRCIVVIGLLLTLRIGVSKTDKVSKACFGSDGLTCTNHNLRCDSGIIVIHKAYYTQNTECLGSGVSACQNFTSIIETERKINFSATEMDILYKACSSHYVCLVKAGIRRAFITFSVVLYSCVQRGHLTVSPLPTIFNKAEITAQRTTATVPENATEPSFNTGALVGALISSVLIIAGAALATVFWLRKRRKQKTEKGDNTWPQKASKEAYSFTNDSPEKFCHELEKQPTNPDYATADGFRMHNRDVNGVPKQSHLDKEGDYDHIGDKQSTLTGDYDATASVGNTVGHTKKGNTRIQDGDVYSYDHLNGATDNAIGDAADYDTTASSKKAVAKLNSKSNTVLEDDYGYNHLGSNHQVKTIQNEYDTTASAVKAVSRLDETGAAAENDYDHVNGNIGYQAPVSPNDTAGNVSDQRDDYNLAGTVTDPYDLAK